jgi:hypothetical protein
MTDHHPQARELFNRGQQHVAKRTSQAGWMAMRRKFASSPPVHHFGLEKSKYSIPYFLRTPQTPHVPNPLYRRKTPEHMGYSKRHDISNQVYSLLLFFFFFFFSPSTADSSCFLFFLETSSAALSSSACFFDFFSFLSFLSFFDLVSFTGVGSNIDSSPSTSMSASIESMAFF